MKKLVEVTRYYEKGVNVWSVIDNKRLIKNLNPEPTLMMPDDAAFVVQKHFYTKEQFENMFPKPSNA